MAIYLDNAATTPLHPTVKAAMIEAMDDFGNPSSIHQYGRHPHFKILSAREQIAKSIGAKTDEIVFTASGSEGDNMALVEGSHAMQQKGRHIISTAIEHPAVLNTLHRLEDEGFEVTYLPVNERGEVSVEDVQQALRDDTILVSIMYGNNEVGSIMPIQRIGALLSQHQALFHTDAVQVYGTEPIDVTTLGVDLLSVAAHKINGPKGIGFLYLRQGTPFQPLITGGEQENHRRAGTENLPAIMGFKEAVAIISDEEKHARHQRYMAFKQEIIQQLTDAGIEVEVNGSLEGLPHILNLWFKGWRSDILLTRLDMSGIAVSSGSACTAGNVAPSHVLESMYGKEHPRVMESLRISFGYQTTEEDIQTLITTLIQIMKG